MTTEELISMLKDYRDPALVAELDDDELRHMAGVLWDVCKRVNVEIWTRGIVEEVQP